jgi:lysophospholipase L1-like esterase
MSGACFFTATKYCNMKTLTAIWITALMLLSIAPATDKITIYLIGDSTIANKETRAFPETGWGMPFRYFFDSTVVVDNRAKNGRSTRTFISQNLWQSVYENLKEGDYVFIQFGHNDEVKEKTGSYTPPEDFKKNLNKFIEETRSKKAIPVLLTPVARRRFKDGKVQPSHEEYSKLVEDVAQQSHVTFIDLDTKSRGVLQKYGDEGSKLLFLQLEPGEHPNYPDGKDDNTHFSETGARLMAEIVLAEIRKLDPALASRVVPPPVKK